jgi:prepilin-type N-terminal cleavage/methylation domain-containing protein
MALAKLKRSSAGQAGFSLIEVLVAMAIMATGVLTMAGMFGLATKSNLAGRSNTYATVLAEQKLEQLRSLAWGFDLDNLPVSDQSTDTTTVPENPIGGTGLTPSPDGSLRENIKGWVDHVDGKGAIVGNDEVPPNGAIYTRRWSVEPLPTNPNNTLIIQVLVTRNQNRGQANQGRVSRLADEARVITVKTRKSQ